MVVDDATGVKGLRVNINTDVKVLSRKFIFGIPARGVAGCPGWQRPGAGPGILYRCGAARGQGASRPEIER